MKRPVPFHRPGVVLALFSLLLSTAWAEPPLGTRPPPSSDRRFLSESARLSMAGVKAGWIASQKAQRQEVKDFARQMMDDDGTIRGQTKALTAIRGGMPPMELDATAERELAALDGASGAA